MLNPDEKKTIISSIDNLFSLKEQIEKENKLVKKYQRIITKQETKIDNLTKELNKEKIKTALFEYELKRNNINFSFDFSILDNEIKIDSKKTKDLTLTIYNSLELDVPEVKTVIKPKKYRSERKGIITTENPEEQEKLVKKVEEEREKLIIINKLDVPVKELTDQISSILQVINESKTLIPKHLEEIKICRFKLLGKFDLSHYTEFLAKNLGEISDVIRKKKKIEGQKLIKETSKYFFPLEKRLLFYGNYFDTSIEPDDINRFRLTLEINQNNPKRYIPFNDEDFCNRINNFGLALISIKSIINKNLVNPFGFNSIIYINRNAETTNTVEDDPFSFYILKKVEDGKRCWDMDCRLYNFSTHLRESLMNFCIKIFRKIYFDVFLSNDFIENYQEKAIIFSQDSEQLLQNIIFCGKELDFYSYIIEVVSKNCIHSKTKNDKFNIKSDDKSIKNKFKTMKDKENQKEEIRETLGKIFDNLKEDQIDDLMNKYKS
jgi:hypothetical protein